MLIFAVGYMWGLKVLNLGSQFKFQNDQHPSNDRIPLHGGAVLSAGKMDLLEVAHLAPVKQIALKLETKLQKSKSLYTKTYKNHTQVEYRI